MKLEEEKKEQEEFIKYLPARQIMKTNSDSTCNIIIKKIKADILTSSSVK